MENIKRFVMLIRNGLAYVYSWLVLCVIIWALIGGQESIKIGFLLKLFGLSLWGVICFAICFGSKRLEKKGFIFQLTCFYILFIPIEILMFYLMGIFSSGSSILHWIIFIVIICFFYLTAIFIDRFIMKKRGDEYTDKLKKYNR